jgi:activator of HSP90 ATPase
MKTIKQRHVVTAPLDEVYYAMTNPLTIELWSGYGAEFSQTEGSEFSLWDGDITGRNLKFIENELIRQQWYFDTQEEQSIVTIRFSSEGKNTIVELLHENVPEEAFEDIMEGWKKYYFGALKKYYQ